MPQGRAPGRIGEGLLGLQPQAVARHHPADPVDNPGRDQLGGGDHRQQRLAATRGDGGEDVAHGLSRLLAKQGFASLVQGQFVRAAEALAASLGAGASFAPGPV
jgi:hypothetical protein